MKPRLLLVDSGEEDVRVLRRFFHEEGYEVETASGGLECLAKLSAPPPDVLVLAHDVPWGGGDGILAWLREEMGAATVPVVLITKVAPPDVLRRLVVPPVVRCLSRPFSLAALREAVSFVAAGRAEVSAENYVG